MFCYRPQQVLKFCLLDWRTSTTFVVGWHRIWKIMRIASAASSFICCAAFGTCLSWLWMKYMRGRCCRRICRTFKKHHNNLASERLCMSVVFVVNLDIRPLTNLSTSVFVGVRLFQFIFASVVNFPLNVWVGKLDFLGIIVVKILEILVAFEAQLFFIFPISLNFTLPNFAGTHRCKWAARQSMLAMSVLFWFYKARKINRFKV